MDSLKRYQRWIPHCPLWSLRAVPGSEDSAASESLHTTYLTLISTSSVYLRVPEKQELLRDHTFHIFALSLSNKPPNTVLESSRASRNAGNAWALGGGTSECTCFHGVPCNPSVRRVRDEKSQKRPIPRWPIRQSGDKYLSSIRGHRQILLPIF